jgi:hypothetical protein
MTRPYLLVLALTACDSDSDITTHGDPPFAIDKATSVLWAEDPGNTQRDGWAVLIISDETIGCDAITSQDFYWNLDDIVLEGQGLMFLLEFDTWGSSSATLDWEGLWMSGYAYGNDAERSLYSFAFSDGFLYYLGGYYGMGATSWLNVVAYASGGASGSYSTEYWSGDFHADHCGEWAGEAGDSTIWDSGYWWWDSDSYDWLDPEVNTVSYGHTDSRWAYEVEFIGWVENATIEIHGEHDGEVWDEDHDLENTEYDPNGAWDRWALELPVVSDWAAQEAGVNTLFAPEDESGMTWMITGYDHSVAPCAVWGADPSWFGSWGCEVLDI